MFPLSFQEFLYFHGFEIRESKSALGGTRKQVFDQKGQLYEPREVFDAYMRFGRMPGIADVGLDQEKAMVLLDGIYFTVVIRDILEREKRRGQRQITDPVLLRKIILFLTNNIGNTVSVSSIGHALENVVYFELLRRGYDVVIGKVDQAEVDFVATKPDQKLYIQVTESMVSPEVRRRELAPLEKIADNYEKLVLSLDVGAGTSYEGIRGMNLVEWLMET